MPGTRKDESVQPIAFEGKAHERNFKLGELSDADVVQASLDGDDRAFGELVRRYDQRLLNFVYRTIGDRERSEDLIQETFVRAVSYTHLTLPTILLV